MIFRLTCTECGASARAEIGSPEKVPPHISPMACALRAAARRGWVYRGGRIGKSVVDVVCPACAKPLYLEGDVDPRDATPGSYESDLRDDPPVSTVVSEDTK